MNANSKIIAKSEEKTSNSIKGSALISASAIGVYALASIHETMLAISIVILAALISISYKLSKKEEEAELKHFVIVMLTAISLAAIKLYLISDLTHMIFG